MERAKETPSCTWRRPYASEVLNISLRIWLFASVCCLHDCLYLTVWFSIVEDVAYSDLSSNLNASTTRVTTALLVDPDICDY